jgi:hypothetical protein
LGAFAGREQRRRARPWCVPRIGSAARGETQPGRRPRTPAPDPGLHVAPRRGTAGFEPGPGRRRFGRQRESDPRTNGSDSPAARLAAPACISSTSSPTTGLALRRSRNLDRVTSSRPGRSRPRTRAGASPALQYTARCPHTWRGKSGAGPDLAYLAWPDAAGCRRIAAWLPARTKRAASLAPRGLPPVPGQGGGRRRPRVRDAHSPVRPCRTAGSPTRHAGSAIPRGPAGAIQQADGNAGSGQRGRAPGGAHPTTGPSY